MKKVFFQALFCAYFTLYISAFAEKPWLYEIERDNKTSHLLGTMHFLPLEEAVTPGVQRLLQSHHFFVSEVGCEDSDDSSNEDILQLGIIRKSDEDDDIGPFLRALRPEQQRRLERILTKLFPEENLEYVFNSTSIKGLFTFVLWDKQQGMDQQLVNFYSPARQRRLDELEDVYATHEEEGAYPMLVQHYLEPISHEISASSLEELTIFFQVLSAYWYNTTVVSADEVVQRWYNCSRTSLPSSEILGGTFYKAGPPAEDLLAVEFGATMIGALVGVTRADLLRGLNSFVQNHSIHVRNLKWIPKIKDYHATLNGSVLFAVGAAHLLGPNGLIKLLRGEGFTIRHVDDAQCFLQLLPEGEAR